jgi:ABC-2 type transport system permease protein
MTTTTIPTTAPTTAGLPVYRGQQKVTQLRVLHAEWTKLRSLPSTAWALLTGITLTVTFGVLYALLRVTHPPRGGVPASFDPTAISLSGVQLAQLAIGVLGVLVITGEYATGQLSTTFAAVPRRLPVLRGKAAVLVTATLATCLPAVVAAFLVSQSVLSSHHLGTTLGQPGVARAVIGSALYLAVIALLGLGLGAIIRNAAGGISALLGLLLALPILVGLLPGTLSGQIGKYLPAAAGQAITAARPDPAMLGPWTGFAVLCLYTAAVLGLAAWLLHRRDA